jgi:hypothetical protein
MKSYLIIGGCGTGKTWVMKRVLSQAGFVQHHSNGLYHWAEADNLVVLGKYDGSTFEGGDRLSMAVMSSNNLVLPLWTDKIVVAEGDRFTNATFIREFNPYIIKILDDGSKGRMNRGSSQTARHIQSIQTRVNNTPFDISVPDSHTAFNMLTAAVIEGRVTERKTTTQDTVNDWF